MRTSILQKIGLTKDQVETYRYLLETGSLSPLELMKKSGESRTNAYMSLAKLEELGLAKRDTGTKKLTYLAVSPATLEQLLDSQAKQLEETRSELHDSLPELLSAFYTSSKKPGIRFYEGKETLNKVYQDHLDTGETVYFVRTPSDETFFGEELYDYMEERAAKGISSEGIAPYTKGRVAYSKANDAKLRRKMTYCAPGAYKAPVEISIYGNKTAFISFGKEVVASIIDSPQIARAMKELFAMAQAGADHSKN